MPRIDEVGTVQLGRQRSPKYQTGKHTRPYLRVANVFDGRIDTSDVLAMDFNDADVAHYELKHGDILLNEGQSPQYLGRSAIYRGEVPGACFQNTLIRFQTDPRLTSPEFAHLLFQYYMYSGRFMPQSRQTTNIAHLGAGRFASMQFILPPLKEQTRILAKLGEVLPPIAASVVDLETAQRRIVTYRAAVLNAACEGRLVPTEAELARGEGREYEDGCALAKRYARSERPNRWASRSEEVIHGHPALAVGNPGSALPEGWIWLPLVEIARMESGHTPSRRHPEWWGGDVPWITLPDARDSHGKKILSTGEQTNAHGLENSAARMLPAGTVCVSRTASVGYVVVMGKPMATSQDFVNWVPTEAVASDWLRIVFMGDREALKRFGKGSVHKTIYFPEWLSIHIALPPRAEQHRIVAEVDRRLSAVEQLESAIDRSLQRAARLRQAILKQAFDGNLVPQDPNDEPAGVLLERSRKGHDAHLSDRAVVERSQLNRRGHLRGKTSTGRPSQAASKPYGDRPNSGEAR